MCFSPTASFIAAGVTGVIGLGALSQSRSPREWPLAAAPIVFAVQQAIEGLTWRELPMSGGGSVSDGLTLAYLLIAQVFWPMFAPAAVLLNEPRVARRRLILPFLALGVGVAAYFLWGLITRSYGASVLGGHIVYETTEPFSLAMGLAYLAAVCAPLLLSSERTIVVLGTIVLVGSAIAYVTYWQAFLSVWCFFAAAGSAVIFGHFVRLRRRPRPVLA